MLTFIVLPFHFETDLGRGAVETGLLITAWPVALGVAAPFSGRLADRGSPALLGGFGMAVLATGLVSLALMPADATTLDILWRVALGGIGFGLFQAPNNRVMLLSAPRERASAASGMLATARLTGSIVGASGAALALRLLPRDAEPVCLWVAAGLALCAGMASLTRRRAARLA